MTDLIKRASETTFCPCEKRNVRTRARVDCTTERRITETNKDQTLYVRARWYLVGCAGYLGIRCTTEYTGRERENEYVCVCERERERELKMERNRRQHTRVSIKPPRARKSRDVEIPATTAGQPEYPRICAATVLHFAADRTISQFLGWIYFMNLVVDELDALGVGDWKTGTKSNSFRLGQLGAKLCRNRRRFSWRFQRIENLSGVDLKFVNTRFRAIGINWSKLEFSRSVRSSPVWELLYQSALDVKFVQNWIKTRLYNSRRLE